MGVFNNWPYTDVHQLNLDFILDTMKDVKGKTDQIDSAVETATTAAENAAESASNAEAAKEAAETAYDNITVYTEELSSQVGTNTNNISIQTARIDEIISGASADPNAELIDIRVGANGVTYATAGDATRAQYSILDNRFIESYVSIPYRQLTSLYIEINGIIRSIGSDTFILYYFPVVANHKYRVVYNNYSHLTNYVAVGFCTSFPAVSVQTTSLYTASTTAEDIDLYYTAQTDGYIVINKAMKSGSVDLHTYEAYYNVVGYRKPLTIQLFGDSITDNQWGDLKTWVNYLAEYMPEYALTIINDAVGGAGIGHGKTGGSSPSHLSDPYDYVWDLVTDGTTLRNDADAIIILVGTNNWAAGTTLGNINSSGPTTVSGALKAIIEYITQHTNAITYICTIPQRYNSVDASRPVNNIGEPLSNNISLYDYNQPFIDIPKHYGQPVINLFSDLGWFKNNINNYTVDGLHPNANGDKAIAKYIASKLKENL